MCEIPLDCLSPCFISIIFSMTSLLNVSELSLGPLNPGVPSPSNVTVFSSSERTDAIAMGVAALISLLLVSLLLFYIIISAILSWWQRHPNAPPPFIKKQVAVFIICLFAADLIQSISGVLQLKWAVENRVYEGGVCTAQAVGLTIGDLGSTVWSCVIASYTFSSIALGKQWSQIAIYAVVITGWSFVGIMAGIGPAALETSSKGPFFGIAGTWCFITSNYPIQRLGIHYIPLFVAALVISVLYVLVFLVLRQSLSFKTRVQHVHAPLEEMILRERVVIAKRMLWYPAAFLTCISPIAILRLVSMHDNHIPDSAWTFGVVLLFLLGALDSVIYTTTRTLVKPIKISLPLRRLSIEAPYVHGDNEGPHSKFGLSDIGPVDINRSPDMAPYTFWDTEDPKQTGGPHFQHQVPSAIRITLEQIKEVR